MRFLDVNSRILDMAQEFAEIQSRDWQAASDPVQFAFGPFVVKEWLARGPDGMVIALIERVEPPLEGYPNLREMGRLISATQIVADEAPEPNVLGMPHNLAAEISRHVSILHPQGTNEGSVELIESKGVTGADFSARAVPPTDVGMPPYVQVELMALRGPGGVWLEFFAGGDRPKQ